MIRSTTLLPISVPVILVGSAILFFSTHERPAVPIGGSGPELHSKRAYHEWERLRDPATDRIPAGIRQAELEFAATHPQGSAAAALFKGNGVAEEEFEWKARGPWNVGGRTRAVALDVTGEDTVLAGGVSGGMWRSVDGGESWRMVTRPDQLPSVTTIVQDTRAGREHIWYFGSGELYGNSASDPGAFWFGNGIYRSTDNGRSWRVLPSTADATPTTFSPISNIWRLALDTTRTDIDRIYAAIYDAVLRSDDGGDTWSTVVGSSATGNSYFSDVALAPDGSVYATLSSDGSAGGIYRSADGESFVQITPDDMPEDFRRIVIGVTQSEPNVVYFLGETPGSGFLGQNFRGDSSWHSLWKYTYVSGDGTGDGGAWENRSANLPSFDWGGGNGDLYSQGSYDLHIKVKPDDADVVFIGGTNLYRSTDGFASTENTSWIGGFRAWDRDSSVIESYSYPEHHADQHDVIFSPTNPDIMFSASDGGVHKTFDCLADSVSWTSLNTGYLTTQFYTVAIDHGTPGDETVMGGLQDNGTWMSTAPDVRAPWVRTGSSDGAHCAISDGGDHLIVSKQLGRIFRVDLDDRGAVRGSARIDPEGAGEYSFINPLILDPSDSRRMYLPIGNKLYRNDRVDTIPTGSNLPTAIGWKELEGAGAPVETETITAIAASTRNPAGRVYFGTNDGRIFRVDEATADAPTSRIISASFMPRRAYVSSIAVDPDDPDHVLISYSNYGIFSIFETPDGGETWRAVAGNLEERAGGLGDGPSVRNVAILPRGGRTLYLAGTSTGLYSTIRLDGNNTVWRKEGADVIGNAVVDMIDARESDGFVAVATHGNGVFSATIGLLSVDEPSAVAGSLRLSEPRPNPVTDRFSIDVDLPSGAIGSEGRVRMVNIDGRTLYDRTIRAFDRSERITIDRSDVDGGLSSGTYFVSVEVAGIRGYRKVVVR